MSKLKELHKYGQSPWYDNIERGLLLSGKIKEMIVDDGITGLTSNPTIFEKAINGSKLYDADIERLSREGKDAQAIYDELTTWDIDKAADVLLEVYTSSGRKDGFVSIEVSPHLAHDTEATIAEAKRLYGKISRANVMIKVPATIEGVEAIRKLTLLGINVNATLVFSLTHYSAVSEAYISGLEERISKGMPVDMINSVASLFVSRIDTYIDRLLNERVIKNHDEKKMRDMEGLSGKAAVAQAKIIYDAYRRTFYTPQFKSYISGGAKVQRLLFGSTSTKNPSYSDVKYVEELIAEGTINTMPSITIEAFKDHGVPQAALIGNVTAEASEILAKLRTYGVAIEEVCQKIQDDGLQAFTDSYDKLIRSLEKKRLTFIS
ncbi:MAG: transaldolase [Candidatus Margulisbacteria bacterium]|nr:transaldolase [Candidatus Margulisiibacteriota bacterium]